MPTPLALLPDLTIGDDPASYSFDLILNGENVALVHPDAVIYAAITDIDITTIFCGPVQCSVASGKWVASFTGDSTLSLLSDRTNLGSKLNKLLLKYPDPNTDDITGRATGFGQAFLELQIGAPYQTRTERNLITIGKGLIPSFSVPSTPVIRYLDGAVLRESGVSSVAPTVVITRYADAIKGRVMTADVAYTAVATNVNRYSDSTLLAGLTADVGYTAIVFKLLDGSRLKGLAADTTYSSAISRLLDGSRLLGRASDVTYSAIATKSLDGNRLIGQVSDVTYSALSVGNPAIHFPVVN